jgi:hypothetical protein
VSAGSDSTYSWCSFVSRHRCRVRLPRCPSRERREIFDVIAADLPPPPLDAHSHRHLLAAAPPYPSRESWVRAWGGGAAVPNDFSSAFPNQIWPQVGITDQFTLTCDDGNMRRSGQQRCYLCPPPPPLAVPPRKQVVRQRELAPRPTAFRPLGFDRWEAHRHGSGWLAGWAGTLALTPRSSSCDMRADIRSKHHLDTQGQPVRARLAISSRSTASATEAPPPRPAQRLFDR